METKQTHRKPVLHRFYNQPQIFFCTQRQVRQSTTEATNDDHLVSVTLLRMERRNQRVPLADGVIDAIKVDGGIDRFSSVTLLRIERGTQEGPSERTTEIRKIVRCSWNHLMRESTSDWLASPSWFQSQQLKSSSDIEQHGCDRVDYYDRASHPSEENEHCNENTSLIDRHVMMEAQPRM